MTERDMDGEPDGLPERAPAATPDPREATTVQEFVRGLRALKAWSGNPSLRELERRTGLPRSTLSGDMSPQRSRLPPLERVLALATAFGVPAEELGRWQSAWQRIQVRQQSAEPPAQAPQAPQTAVEPAVPSAPVEPVAPTPPAAVERPAPDAAPQPPREPDRTGLHRFARRRLLWPVLPVGGLLAVLLALPPTAAPVTGGRTAAASVQPSSPAGDQPSFPGGARMPDACGYLGRISDRLAASPLDAAATTGESLQIRNPVAKGDTLIVTLMLAGAGTGPITVRDTAGNRYRVVRDETTDGTRLTVLALFDARPLDSLDQITFLWPSSKHDYTEVDEFRGVRSAAPVSDPGAPGDPPVGAKDPKQCGEGGVTSALRGDSASGLR